MFFEYLLQPVWGKKCFDKRDSFMLWFNSRKAWCLLQNVCAGDKCRSDRRIAAVETEHRFAKQTERKIFPPKKISGKHS